MNKTYLLNYAQDSFTPAEIQMCVPSSLSAHPSPGMRKILGQNENDKTAASRVERWDQLLPANQVGVGRLSMVINKVWPLRISISTTRHQRPRAWSSAPAGASSPGNGFMASTKRDNATSYNSKSFSQVTRTIGNTGICDFHINL